MPIKDMHPVLRRRSEKMKASFHFRSSLAAITKHSLVRLGILMLVLVPLSAHSVTFQGDVSILDDLIVSSALSKGSGTFIIDHPLSPRTHLLYHSFVESPDVKNLYDGVATLDENGEVTISLPDYFEALNKNFRYQFFAHLSPMPNLHVKQEMKDNQFVIAGGVPGGEISWQITGIRHDAFILAKPILNEVPKGPDQIVNVGECLFEPLCR